MRDAMTCWINREAEQKLRNAMDEHEFEIHQLNAPDDYQAGCASGRGAVLAALDRMHVIDAGDDEAEAALERLQERLPRYWGGSMALAEEWHERDLADLATIRARLRAASAWKAEAEMFQQKEIDDYERGKADGLRAARASHTPEEIEAAESVARYHDEHAAYGGLSQEFHERAASILRTLVRRPEPAAKPASEGSAP